MRKWLVRLCLEIELTFGLLYFCCVNIYGYMVTEIIQWLLLRIPKDRCLVRLAGWLAGWLISRERKILFGWIAGWFRVREKYCCGWQIPAESASRTRRIFSFLFQLVKWWTKLHFYLVSFFLFQVKMFMVLIMVWIMVLQMLSDHEHWSNRIAETRQAFSMNSGHMYIQANCPE